MLRRGWERRFETCEEFEEAGKRRSWKTSLCVFEDYLTKMWLENRENVKERRREWIARKERLHFKLGSISSLCNLHPFLSSSTLKSLNLSNSSRFLAPSLNVSEGFENNPWNSCCEFIGGRADKTERWRGENIWWWRGKESKYLNLFPSSLFPPPFLFNKKRSRITHPEMMTGSVSWEDPEFTQVDQREADKGCKVE